MERRSGHLESAEDYLANAVRFLAEEPLALEQRARLCLVLGRVRVDQARTDGALALFERSRRLAEELGHDEFQAAAALALGTLLVEQDDPESALPVLWEAYHLASERPNLKFGLSALEALPLAMADSVRLQELPGVLEALNGLRPQRLTEPLDEVRIAWTEARVDWRLGDAGAIPTLQSVFSRLLELDSPLQAAAARLELATWRLTADEPLQTLAASRRILNALPSPAT